MTRQDEGYERLLAQTLAEQAARSIPSTTDLWPSIQRRLTERASNPATIDQRAPHQRARRGAVIIGLAATVTTVGGLTAAAASPQLRQAVHQKIASVATDLGLEVSVSVGGPNAGDFGVMPAPPFRLATLRAIPPMLTQHQFTYIPARQRGTRQQPDISVVEGSTPGQERRSGVVIVVPAGGIRTRPSHAGNDRLDQLASRGVATAWLHFVAPPPDTRYLDLVEQRTPAHYHLPAGQAVSLPGTRAMLQQERAETIVTLTRFGTMVTLRTNIGRAATLHIAARLVWE